MDLKDLFTSLTILCSLIIALIALLNFKRSQKSENENVIYKYKIEGYFIIVEKLLELIDLINNAREEINNKNFSNELNNSADNIDFKAGELFKHAYKYSLLFPQNIINLLDDIHKKINEDPPSKFDKSKIENYIKISDEHLQILSNRIDALYDEIRKDLGSIKLNISLSKRLR